MRAALQGGEWPLEHQSTEVSLCHKDAQQKTENVIYEFCVHVGDGVTGISVWCFSRVNVCTQRCADSCTK